MGDDRGPVRVGELVGGFLAARGLDAQVERMGVMERWGRVVGPAIAEVTSVRGLQDATLFVEVRSSAWNLVRTFPSSMS